MRVVVRVFGQTLTGREHCRFVDHADGQEWVIVHLDHTTVIGGVGPGRDYVTVVPRVVEQMRAVPA